MIKRILVPLDPSPFSESAIKYASYIAKKQDATITGLVTLDIEGIEKSIGGYPRGGLYWAEKLEEFKEEQAKERIDELLKKFRDTCDKESVKHKEAEEQGSPSGRILHDSIFYDLIVIGQKTYFHFESSDKPGDSLEKILDHSATPILAVPGSFKPIKKVVIAFDGSLPAARALQRFAHFAKEDDFEIQLLMAKTDLETGEFYLNKAEEYLKDYGIKNIKKEWTPEDIIDVVQQKYLNNTDLFVTGMHSKKSLLDFFVGSLPKYLLSESKSPVFIGQ